MQALPADAGAVKHGQEGGPTAVEVSLRRTARIAAAIGCAALIAASVHFFGLLLDETAVEGLRTALIFGGAGLGAALGGLGVLRIAWSRESEFVYGLVEKRARGREAPEELRASPGERFTLGTARAAAAEGDLEGWAHRYLTGPGNNEALSRGLWSRRRYWRGPIRVSIEHLTRTCGPEPGMPFREDAGAWNRRIEELRSTFTRADEWPPLIVEYEEGRLMIRDGNHRFAALESLGEEACWIVLWYPDGMWYHHHGDRGFRIPAEPRLADGETNEEE